MKCLVVGGAGFVGKHLCAALREEGHQILCTSRSGEHRRADVSSYSDMERAVREFAPDAIVNLAAVARGSVESMCRVHGVGAANLLTAAREHAPRARLLFIGSAAEYGHQPPQAMPLTETTPGAPVNPYGVTKLAATQTVLSFAEAWNLRAWVVRPFNIVGPGIPSSLVVGALIERLRAALAAGENPTIKVGRTDTLRDYVAVSDVVAGLTGLLHSDAAAGVYNLCSGQGVSVQQIMEMLRSVTGKTFAWRQDDALVRPDDPLVSYGSYAKLHNAIGFIPRMPLPEALDRAWQAANREPLTLP